MAFWKVAFLACRHIPLQASPACEKISKPKTFSRNEKQLFVNTQTQHLFIRLPLAQNNFPYEQEPNSCGVHGSFSS